jgi:ABC-type branched-subunit amino acid transport system substrate-binding protein
MSNFNIFFDNKEQTILKKAMLKVSLYSLLCLLLIINSFIGCKPETESKEKVFYLGSVMLLDFYNGTVHANSVQTAIDEINQAGGILNGYMLKADLRSTEPIGNRDRGEMALYAARNIMEMRENALLAVITASSTASKAIALDLGEINKVPVISGGSTANSNSGISTFFHRTAPPDRYTAKLLAQKSIDYQLDKIAIAIESNDIFTRELAQSFVEEFEILGGIISDTVYFESNDALYTEKLQQIYAKKPDAVFADFLVNYEVFFNQIDINAQNFLLDKNNLKFILAVNSENIIQKTPFTFLSGYTNQGFPKVFAAESSPDKTTESYRHFASAYEHRFDGEFTTFMANFYDAVYIIALAAEKAFALGASPENMADFRIKLNEQIRQVSNPEGTIIEPQEGWDFIRKKAIAGDIDYLGASGNCDIDFRGDVITNYNISMIVLNENNKLEFKIIENIYVR